MNYSSSCSHTYFTSGETAPSAEAVHAGAPIPNNGGRWALTKLEVISSDTTSNIVLDTTAQPPILRLRNVGAVGVWGLVVADEFMPREEDADAGYWVVSGDYSGAGSRLIAE